MLFLWLADHFYECLEDAGPAVVENNMPGLTCGITQVVFSDGTGDIASLLFLDPLRNWDVKWSWGSEALAFLYRQVMII